MRAHIFCFTDNFVKQWFNYSIVEFLNMYGTGGVSIRSWSKIAPFCDSLSVSHIISHILSKKMWLTFNTNTIVKLDEYPFHWYVAFLVADTTKKYEGLKCEQKMWLTWHVADTTSHLLCIKCGIYFIQEWDLLIRGNVLMPKCIIGCAYLWLTAC